MADLCAELHTRTTTDHHRSDKLVGIFIIQSGDGLMAHAPAVHFLRILQWWGKTAKGPILSLPPPSGQYAIAEGGSRVPKGEGTSQLGGLGACPQEIFKLESLKQHFLHSENTFKKNLSFSKQSFNGEICNKLHAKHSNTT